jgi:hypothetical protein
MWALHVGFVWSPQEFFCPTLKSALQLPEFPPSRHPVLRGCWGPPVQPAVHIDGRIPQARTQLKTQCLPWTPSAAMARAVVVDLCCSMALPTTLRDTARSNSRTSSGCLQLLGGLQCDMPVVHHAGIMAHIIDYQSSSGVVSINYSQYVPASAGWHMHTVMALAYPSQSCCRHALITTVVQASANTCSSVAFGRQ